MYIPIAVAAHRYVIVGMRGGWQRPMGRPIFRMCVRACEREKERERETERERERASTFRKLRIPESENRVESRNATSKTTNRSRQLHQRWWRFPTNIHWLSLTFSYLYHCYYPFPTICLWRYVFFIHLWEDQGINSPDNNTYNAEVRTGREFVKRICKEIYFLLLLREILHNAVDNNLEFLRKVFLRQIKKSFAHFFKPSVAHITRKIVSLIRCV